jgi:hypothetical protein
MKLQLSIIFCILFFLTGLVIGCHTCAGKKQAGSKIANVRTDTITKFVTVKDSTNSYTPRIAKVVSQHPGIWNGKSSTPYSNKGNLYNALDPAPTDTAAILALYDYEIYVNDTVKTDYGFIRINDKLTRSKISSRQVFTDFEIPERIITKTITLNTKPRNELWLGALLNGNKLDPFSGLGATIALKTKHAKQFQVAAIYGNGGFMNYQLAASFKLGFRKQ